VLSRFRNEGMQIILVAIVTAIAGEFKVTPFSGELFRIGLGSSTFLLCLLLMRQLPYVYTAVVTGIAVLLFRTIEDSFVTSFASFSFVESIQTHFSSMLYYLVYGVGLSRFKSRLHKFHPLILGACVSLIDVISNESELFARSIIFGLPYMYTGQWTLIITTAVVRSYFVVGLFSSISINQMRVLHHEQQKRMEQMLNIGSGLYGEVFYLKKSMDTIEQITAKSHALYCRLNETGEKGVSRSILEITQQIHEVKKDSQRILAGLLKLFDREIPSDMPLAEIVEFVIKSNRDYSKMLHKDITMEADIRVGYRTEHYIPLLTVLGNLVSNAVEAIDAQGTIRIRIYEHKTKTIMVVSDSGTGIAEQDKEMIFEPGFTTKFNNEGNAATGIGLSHVRDIVHAYGGELHLHASRQGAETTFTVTFLSDSLKKGV
jgi:two-component system sensor histidine kinase YcbA